MRFLRNTDSGGQSLGDRRTFKVLIAGLVPLLIFIFLSLFVPTLTETVLVAPVSLILLLFAIALLVNAFSTPQPKDASEKRKREMENVNMYSTIDRLVDDLDEDEIEYFRQRLEVRGADRPITKSVETLLDKRSEARQSESQQ